MNEWERVQWITTIPTTHIIKSLDFKVGIEILAEA